MMQSKKKPCSSKKTQIKEINKQSNETIVSQTTESLPIAGPSSESSTQDGLSSGISELATDSTNTDEQTSNREKRPLNPYFIWSGIERTKLYQQSPKVDNIKISKILGERWKALSLEERRPFVLESRKRWLFYKQKHQDSKPQSNIMDKTTPSTKDSTNREEKSENSRVETKKRKIEHKDTEATNTTSDIKASSSSSDDEANIELGGGAVEDSNVNKQSDPQGSQSVTDTHVQTTPSISGVNSEEEVYWPYRNEPDQDSMSEPDDSLEPEVTKYGNIVYNDRFLSDSTLRIEGSKEACIAQPSTSNLGDSREMASLPSLITPLSQEQNTFFGNSSQLEEENVSAQPSSSFLDQVNESILETGSPFILNDCDTPEKNIFFSE